MIHPGLLDTAFQSVFAAYCSLGDNRFWSIHVPTKIRSIIINPNLCGSNLRKEAILPFKSSVRSEFTGDIRADVDVYCEGGHEVFIEIDAISLVPFSRASPDDDSRMFSKFEWGVSCEMERWRPATSVPVLTRRLWPMTSNESVSFILNFSSN